MKAKVTRFLALAALLLLALLLVARSCQDDAPAPPLGQTPGVESAAAAGTLPSESDSESPGRKRVSKSLETVPTRPDAPGSGETSDSGPSMSGPHPLEELNVSVVDTNGELVAGAEVVLFENHPHGGYDAWRSTETALTDGTGRAAFHVSGGTGVMFRATYGDLMESADPISRFGGSRVRDLTLRLSPGQRVHGRVRDSDSLRPVAGAQLELFSAPWSQTVETDADGRFVSGVVHQDAVLHVVFTSGFRVRAEGYVADTAEMTFRDGLLELVVRPATRVTFQLVRPNGLPDVSRDGYVELGPGIPSAPFEADAQGRVTVDVRLDPGTPFEVWPDDGEIVRFPAHPARPANLDLGELVVHPCGEVSGVVVNATGAPVFRARVEIHSADGGYAIDVESSNVDGEFELERVGRGPHVVTVTRWNDETNTVCFEGVMAGATDLRAVLATSPDDD